MRIFIKGLIFICIIFMCFYLALFERLEYVQFVESLDLEERKSLFLENYKPITDLEILCRCIGGLFMSFFAILIAKGMME